MSTPAIVCLVLGALLVGGIGGFLFATRRPDDVVLDQLRRDAAPYDTEVMNEAFDQERQS